MDFGMLGKVLFDYKFIQRLDHGSFGVVYEAENVHNIWTYTFFYSS